MAKSIKAFAPATVANVACGFDVLGFVPVGYENLQTGKSYCGETNVFTAVLISKDGVKREIVFFTDDYHNLEISTVKISTPLQGIK